MSFFAWMRCTDVYGLAVRCQREINHDGLMCEAAVKREGGGGDVYRWPTMRYGFALAPRIMRERELRMAPQREALERIMNESVIMPPGFTWSIEKPPGFPHPEYQRSIPITEYDGPNALKLACDHLLRLASRERLSCECAKEALFV